MVVLYEKNATKADWGENGNNGLCVLSPSSCTVHEVAGGEYELELEHPMDEYGKYLMLSEERLIKAPVPVTTIPETELPELVVWKVTTASDLYQKTPVMTYSGDNWQRIKKVKDNPSAYAYNTMIYYNRGALVHSGGTVYEATLPSINVIPGMNWMFWSVLGTLSSVQSSYDPGKVIQTLPIDTKVVKISDAGNWTRVRLYGTGTYGFIDSTAITETTERQSQSIPEQTIRDQVFRIYEVSCDEETNCFTVHARHISYDFKGNSLLDCKITDGTPTEAITAIQIALIEEDTRAIATDITGKTITADWSFKNPINALLDPDSGVVGKLKARLIRNNEDYYLLDSSSARTGITIAYGVNMLGVNWTRNIENVVTRVVPRSGNSDKGYKYISDGGKISNGTVPDQGKMYVESEGSGDFQYQRYYILNCSYSEGQEYEKADGTKTKYTEADVLQKMKDDALAMFTKDHVDGATYELDVQFLLLGDTEEYKQYRGLQTVCLYDVIGIKTGKSGIDATAQVTEYEYDCLRLRYNSITLGQVNSFKKRMPGYRVVNESITYEKLAPDLINRIVTNNASGSTDSGSAGTGTTGGAVDVFQANTVSADGIVTKGSGQANKVWKTDSDGNPAWRSESGAGFSVIDSLTSTSTTDALSANQGKVLNDGKMNIPKRFSVSGNGSKTFTIDNSSNIRITTFGNSGNMLSETLIYTHSSGAVRIAVVKAGSNVSIASSGNNTITISNSNSAGFDVLFEIFKGNISEANA